MTCETCKHWGLKQQDNMKTWGACLRVKITETICNLEHASGKAYKNDIAVIGDRESTVLFNKNFGCRYYEAGEQ